MDTFGHFGSSVYSDDYFKLSLNVFWGGSVEPPKKCSAFCSDECLVIHCWKTFKSKGMNFFPCFDQKTLQSTKDSNWHIFFSCIWHIYTERHIVFVSINVFKTSPVKLSGVNIIRTFPFPFPFLSYLYISSGKLFARIKLLALACMDTTFIFSAFFPFFSFQNCILTMIILLAFLYHQCEGTEKLYCSVCSAWNESALLWRTVFLPLMESASAATSQFIQHRRNESLAIQPWNQWLDIQCNSHHLMYAQRHTNIGSKFLWCYFWSVSELEKLCKVCFWKLDLNFLLRQKNSSKTLSDLVLREKKIRVATAMAFPRFVIFLLTVFLQWQVLHLSVLKKPEDFVSYFEELFHKTNCQRKFLLKKENKMSNSSDPGFFLQWCTSHWDTTSTRYNS